MPLVTIPALAAEGMTVAEMAAAAAAAAEATTAATATAAATPAFTTAAMPGALSATTSAAPSLTGMTAAEVAGGTGANAGLLSGEVAAAQGAGAGAGGAGITAGGAGTVPGATGAEALTASTGEGIMTDAGLQSAGAQMGPDVPVNEIGRAQIEQLTAPFGSNPMGMPPYPQPSPAGMPGNPFPELPGVDVPYNPQLPGIDVPYQSSTGNAFERGIQSAMRFAKDNPYTTAAATTAASYLMRPEPPEKKQYAKRDLSGFQRGEPATSEYTPIYTPSSYAANGGLMGYAVGGQVEQMAAQNAVGANTGYPMANLQTPMYANPMVQRPQATNVIAPSVDAGVNTYTGEPRFAEGGGVPAVERLEERNRKLLGIKTPQEIEEDFERGQDVMRREGFGIVTDADVDTRRKSPLAASMTQLKKVGKRVGTPIADMPKSDVIDTDVFHAARGGITYGLGGYSDGGRLLKGPGDGVSDSIPASIGGRQPARLADGEFVVPARIVSELGNGSTEAGARKLYAMMERVQKARKKSVGKDKVAVNSRADKHLPA